MYLTFKFTSITSKDDNQILKSRIRLLRFIARLTATLLAIPTLILETLTLTKFYSTRDTIRNGRGPWAAETSLWPSILLLSASSITVLLGFLILTAYMWGSIRAANRVNTVQTTVTVVVEVVHIGFWIAISVLYREGRTGKDLWGWACGGVADSIQKAFDGVVDFDTICRRGVSLSVSFEFFILAIGRVLMLFAVQGVNWALSIANAGFTIFNLSIFYWVLKRRSYVKVQEQLAERRLLDHTDF